MDGGERAEVLIVDGYVDDPAALGVPPYLSPAARAAYGAATDAGTDARYITVDMVRGGCAIPRADVSVVISGNTVPGRYLRSMPMSQREMTALSVRLSGTKIVGGSSAFSPAGTRFDVRAGGDLAASLYDFLKGRELGGRQRSIGEWNRWMLLGAETATEHQDFPDPLVVEMESYRGCHRYASGGCSFCIEPAKGRPLMRSPRDILAEASRLRELGVRNVRVGGQTCIVSYGSEDFTSGCPRPEPARVRELFEGLRDLHFDSLSVDNANPAVISSYPEEASEVIRILAECCSSGNVLAMGLESADPAVAAANNLNSGAEQVLEAVRTVNRIGGERGETGLPRVLPGINIVCGLDGETAGTYEMDLGLLRRIRDEGLLLRRINIRQVIASRRPFDVKVMDRRFRRFKEAVREEIDRPMLESMIPFGTVLKGVYAEIRDGNTTFGRQSGSYPLLVGVPYRLDLGRRYDIAVTGWGYRSVTGVEFPFDVDSAPMSALTALPGIGRRRAAAIVARRPLGSFERFAETVGDGTVSERLREIVTFRRIPDPSGFPRLSGTPGPEMPASPDAAARIGRTIGLSPPRQLHRHGHPPRGPLSFPQGREGIRREELRGRRDAPHLRLVRRREGEGPAEGAWRDRQPHHPRGEAPHRAGPGLQPPHGGPLLPLREDARLRRRQEAPHEEVHPRRGRAHELPPSR